jgi:hypothetical protein
MQHLLYFLFIKNFTFFSETTLSEEQLARQLISLHRAVSHRDKSFLRQLMRRCDHKLDMSLPLRGVTALSLSVYLKHNDMTAELLSIMKQTRQIGKSDNLEKEHFSFTCTSLFINLQSEGFFRGIKEITSETQIKKSS